jgi:hypothetical protein
VRKITFGQPLCYLGGNQCDLICGFIDHEEIRTTGQIALDRRADWQHRSPDKFRVYLADDLPPAGNGVRNSHG